MIDRILDTEPKTEAQRAAKAKQVTLAVYEAAREIAVIYHEAGRSDSTILIASIDDFLEAVRKAG